MINNDKTINVETKKQQNEQIDKIAFNKLRIYITIDYTYHLLYCKGHIQMINNDNTINVEMKNNRMNKMTKLH